MSRADVCFGFALFLLGESFLLSLSLSLSLSFFLSFSVHFSPTSEWRYVLFFFGTRSSP